MSSFVGHASVGVALYLARPPASARFAQLGVLVLLAILPDFDYLALWCFGINAEPRFTHSLVFAMFAACLTWLATRRLASALPFVTLALAACSHLVLDTLVGVHPVCVMWPFPLPQWQSPLGLLPSAGRIDPRNVYFWRNLLIETGVLVPLFALYAALQRGLDWRRIARIGLVVLPMWCLFLAWSIRIHA